MKKIQLLIAFLMLIAYSSYAQKDISKRKSPPQQVKMDVDDAEVAVSYGSPSVRKREVWGKLVPYHKVWRTGANEATTFEVTKDVKIEGKILKAGKYALFTIPTEGEWTVIFNSDPNQWGAYNYDKALDVLRVKVKPTESDEHTESMKFEMSDGGKVIFKWDKLKLIFTVSS